MLSISIFRVSFMCFDSFEIMINALFFDMNIEV